MTRLLVAINGVSPVVFFPFAYPLSQLLDLSLHSREKEKTMNSVSFCPSLWHFHTLCGVNTNKGQDKLSLLLLLLILECANYHETR